MRRNGLTVYNDIKEDLEVIYKELIALKIIAIHKGEELLEWAKAYDEEHNTEFYKILKEVI